MRILVLLAILLCGTARADEMTGNEMLSLCQSSPNFVTGYVTGVIEGGSRAAVTVIAKYSSGPPGHSIKTQEEANAWVSRLKDVTSQIEGYCIPSGVTRVQSKDVACKYIQDNPSVRHLSAAGLVKAGLTQVWPCVDN